MLSKKHDMKNQMLKNDICGLVLKSVLFLSGIMTGLKMLSALNISTDFNTNPQTSFLSIFIQVMMMLL
jgi:hypothetical protein